MLADAEEEEKVKTTTAVVVYTEVTVLAGNWLVNFFLNGAMHGIWSLLNQL